MGQKEEEEEEEKAVNRKFWGCSLGGMGGNMRVFKEWACGVESL